MIRDVYTGCRIPDPYFFSSLIMDTDPGFRGKKHWIPDPDPQHCLLRYPGKDGMIHNLRTQSLQILELQKFSRPAA